MKVCRIINDLSNNYYLTDLTDLSNINLSTVTAPQLCEPEELIKWKADRAERLEKKGLLCWHCYMRSSFQMPKKL